VCVCVCVCIYIHIQHYLPILKDRITGINIRNHNQLTLPFQGCLEQVREFRISKFHIHAALSSVTLLCEGIDAVGEGEEGFVDVGACVCVYICVYMCVGWF
jgi:hypothetical protein